MRITSESPIPLTFALARVPLSWPEILWAYGRGWIKDADVVQLAVERVAEEEVGTDLVELAGILPHELFEVPALLERLAKTSGTDDSKARRKWLYILLSWLYEHRQQLEDPLGLVEEVYADFDYPEEIVDFVRYMPPRDHYEPQAHTPEENRDRLFGKWKHYLDSFSPDDSGEEP